ncbi:MAG: DUF222 domain-containing protein [Arachnia sp.]
MDERERALAAGRARDAAWDRSVARIGALSSQLAQVHAEMVEETAALLKGDVWAGQGVRSPQHFLQVFGWLSPAHANQLVVLARRCAELPETMELMEQGRLSLDQAVVVAEHVPAEFSAGGAELAEMMTVSQLRRTLSRYCFEDGAVPADPDVPAAEKEAGPELTMNSHGRRFQLHFEASHDDGALVEQAIREAKDALFAAGNPKATLADGFLAMAGRSLEAVTTVARREHYKVVIHLDVDGKGWLGKKGGLPETLLRRFTCEGKVTPVWEKDGNPVSVGRSQRIVPERTRRLVEDRDRGCRYPGCSVTGFLENHHLIHWADGGPTDPENLLSLCPFHHGEHHKGGFTIAGSPVTPSGLVFTTPRGYAIGPVKPYPPPSPPDPTPSNTEILRGDWCDNQWLTIRSNEQISRRAMPRTG